MPGASTSVEWNRRDEVHRQEYRIAYLPAECDTAMFRGNSNWRGPIWMPVNALLLRALLNFYLFYGDSFKIECPTRSGKMMNLFEVAAEIGLAAALIHLFGHLDAGSFLESGRRAVFGTEDIKTAVQVA